MIKTNTKLHGFTIVELLIVIVVIGILAAITIVVFNGVQQRARNSDRVQDIATIKKMVLAYTAQNGKAPFNYGYGSVGAGGWDTSTLSGWISPLQQLGSVPRDPKNDLVGDPLQDSSTGYGYFYYCWPTASPYVNLGYYTEGATRQRVVTTFSVDACDT